jgi:SPFH domain / Band 7 family
LTIGGAAPETGTLKARSVPDHSGLRPRVAVIDERIQTTAFSAEAALTKDTVPVNVDAIIFWFVHDTQKAALNITNYREAIDRISQTSLYEMIGSSMLSALLSERTAADALLRDEISRKTADWGISVNSVEIRDVAIPVALQDAMSRQAQAERDKQARVILGSAEVAIAAKFVEAAMTYADHPTALQLRAMNIIYEMTKERGATILIPTSMVDSMNPWRWPGRKSHRKRRMGLCLPTLGKRVSRPSLGRQMTAIGVRARPRLTRSRELGRRSGRKCLLD